MIEPDEAAYLLVIEPDEEVYGLVIEPDEAAYALVIEPDEEAYVLVMESDDWPYMQCFFCDVLGGWSPLRVCGARASCHHRFARLRQHGQLLSNRQDPMGSYEPDRTNTSASPAISGASPRLTGPLASLVRVVFVESARSPSGWDTWLG